MAEKKRDFSCPECAAEFTTQEELDGHKEHAHGNQTVNQKQQQPQKRTA